MRPAALSRLTARLRDPAGVDVSPEQCAAVIEALAKRVETLARMDREAAEHVETVIISRTGFTGYTPYVGWRGLGLALNEALDERDALRAEARPCWLERMFRRVWGWMT